MLTTRQALVRGWELPDAEEVMVCPMEAPGSLCTMRSGSYVLRLMPYSEVQHGDLNWVEDGYGDEPSPGRLEGSMVWVLLSLWCRRPKGYLETSNLEVRSLILAASFQNAIAYAAANS